MFKFKQAIASDTDKIALLNVTCWRESFNEFISKDFLDQISLEKSIKIWTKYFDDNNGKNKIVLALNEKVELVGFVSFGNSRILELNNYGEIFSLNILKDYQNLGIGKRLFLRAVETMCIDDYQSFFLWVLEDNHIARNFYKQLGGQYLMSSTREIGGKKFNQICLSWENRK